MCSTFIAFTSNFELQILCSCDFLFLRSHFGEEVMGVEQGKKENRSEYGFYQTMKEFLDVRLVTFYKYTHISLPPPPPPRNTTHPTYTW